MRTSLAGILGAFIVAIATNATAALPIYRITDLGDLAGGPESSAALAINNAGQIVGYGFDSSGERPTLWLNGEPAVLSGVGIGSARGINGAGQIVGVSNNLAFVWQSTVATPLNPFRFSPSNQATAINDAGQVVGFGSDNGSADRAFRWESGATTLLGVFEGSSLFTFDNYNALAINASGQVAGYVDAPKDRPFTWSAGVYTPLPNFTGIDSNAYARAINDSGIVAGTGSNADGSNRAAIWRNGSIFELGDPLGILPAPPESDAYAINASGLVVGDFYGGAARGAFVWAESVGMLDLMQLIDPLDPLRASTVLVSARDINDSGQIVGLADIDGKRHAFLLTPIPEPSTYLMMLAGLAVCCTVRVTRSR